MKMLYELLIPEEVRVVLEYYWYYPVTVTYGQMFNTFIIFTIGFGISSKIFGS